MGLFDALIATVKTASTVASDAKKRKIEKSVPAEVVEHIGERTWLLNGENGVKGSLDKYLSKGWEYPVADAVMANACPYFQDKLEELSADTVRMLISPRSKAKKPKGWEFYDDGYPVVNARMEMVGSMPPEKLKRAGYSVGDVATFAVLRPPYTDGHIKIYALVTDKGREHERQVERKRAEKRCGGRLPKEYDEAVINFDDGKWLGPRSMDGVNSVNIALELVPTPKGSKAKPHVLVKIGDTVLYEATARNQVYETLLAHVGETPLSAAYQRLDSTQYLGSQYWKLSMAWKRTT